MGPVTSYKWAYKSRLVGVITPFMLRKWPMSGRNLPNSYETFAHHFFMWKHPGSPSHGVSWNLSAQVSPGLLGTSRKSFQSSRLLKGSDTEKTTINQCMVSSYVIIFHPKKSKEAGNQVAPTKKSSTINTCIFRCVDSAMSFKESIIHQTSYWLEEILHHAVT